MVTVLAIYSPHKGQSLLCHHSLCFCKSLSPNRGTQRSETAYLFSRGQCPLTPLLPTHPILQEDSPRCPNLYPWILPLTEDTLHKEIMPRNCLQRVALPAHYTTASLNSQNLMIRISLGSALPKVRKEGHPCYHGHFHFPGLWWEPVACCLGSFSRLYLAPYSPSSQVTWPQKAYSLKWLGKINLQAC